MKRILFVHEVYGRLAGAEQNIIVTAPHLAKTFDLAFLYDSRSGKDEAAFAAVFPRSHQVPFADDAAAEVATQRVLAAERPDLIYVHKCIALGVLRALVKAGIPLVRMEHDHDIYCMRSYKYFPWSRRICQKKAGPCCIFPCLAFLKRDRSRGRFGVRLVSYRRQMECIRLNQEFRAFFVVTDYMREELIRQGFAAERIHIFPPVPPPTDTLFASTFSERNLIIYAGQILRGKGVDCLIRAFARLQHPARLIILGSGSYQEACQKLAHDLGVAERVEFPGFVSRDRLAEYYAHATMAVVPSVWPEPIATIGLEVLRYGIPVVGFDAGGIRDWLRDGETGYLIPWMDIETMSQRLDQLLGDKELARRLGAQGREFVNRVYNFEDYIARLGSTLASFPAGPN
jgi:glycosyltransferase involved in cell wall biosynthesis